MAKSKKRRKLVIQFIEYMVSGGVYFWVGYVILDYLYYARHWGLWWATIISNIIGWTVNYILQRFWVFNNQTLKGHQTQVTGRYTVITLVDFLLNYVILYGLRLVGITPAIGQFISSGFFTVWNYLWYRFWVFPEKLGRRRTVVTPARVVAHRAHGHSAYHRISS
ncbi:MAG TPA: GtrA family protein [Candidatus Saccharimonadales bacterium]|nr:GtrA family protein [Candidatus Saccharimonadales bacterium]